MAYLTLAFHPDDIRSVLSTMYTELNILVAALIAVVVFSLLLIFVSRRNKPLKSLLRGTAWIAFTLVLITVTNLILSGPMYSMVNTVVTSLEQADDSADVCTDLAREGIVLLKNDGILPLEEGSKVNTFGWSSVNAIYDGIGADALSALHPTVSYLQGLTSGGLEYNAELTDWYTAWRAERPVLSAKSQDWTIPEPTQAEYEAAGIYDRAAAFSDTAIFLVSRSGCDGADLPTSYAGATGISEYADDLDASKHYLELSNREAATLTALNEKFDNIIVIINAASPMELGFLENYANIRACVLVPGGPGQTGFNALGELLTGKANFSGKTTDIFLKDLTHSPSWNNFGHFQYANMTDLSAAGSTPTFVNCNEGIYVGYRFWETASREGTINYDEEVIFPFGYGLSYTTFRQTLDAVTYDGTTVSVTVTVENTGAVAGKDVVQVYYEPPYTNGGIEKASANLIAFDKTGTLEPGMTETLELSWDVTDMASYDDTANGGYGAWITKQGQYIISINADSHSILARDTITVTSDILNRTSDAVKSTNRFQFAENEEAVTYLSRKDGFANYNAAVAGPTSFEMSAESMAGFYNHTNYDPTRFNDPNDEIPATGVQSGILLQDMRGLAYDDPRWEPFLDQLTVDDMVNLIASGGYQTAAAHSVGKTRQIDGGTAASVSNIVTDETSICFPSAVMIAATWNTDLACAFGSTIGELADRMDVSGWYGPSVSIHRSPFSGQSFENYSEDPCLSGRMAAATVQGAASQGVYTYLRNFALANQATNRTQMLCTWLTEQSAREIYCKPLELAVKAGGANAVMSADNYIGNQYAGACDALLNDLLREEWGFRGMVLTDFFGGYGYQDADVQIRNGGDFCQSPMGTGAAVPDDQTSATSLRYARQACKNILYVTANSRAYVSETDVPAPAWQKAVWYVSAGLVLILLLLEIRMIFKCVKAVKAAARARRRSRPV